MCNVEFNLNVKSKEAGSKFRIPTAGEFIEAIKNAYNGNTHLAPFIEANEIDIEMLYNTFAASFRKVNGNTVDAAIYVAARINFNPDDINKFSLSLSHSRLKGLEQVRMSFGGTKLQKENENV